MNLNLLSCEKSKTMNTRNLLSRILIDLSYDNLPNEAKHYVNRLVNKASKKPFVLKILKGFHDSVIKTDDIECLFIDADQGRKVGCLWYLKTNIFLLVFSLLTGVVIPGLLRENYCLFLQSVFIASSYSVKSDTDKTSPYDWDYE